MFSPVSSTRVPDEALESPLVNSDFRSIQVLRKTCCGLRNFIDDVTLCKHVTKIRITVQSESIIMKFDLVNENCSQFEIGYQKHRDGCTVSRYDSEVIVCRFIPNTSVLETFCKDFSILLRQHSSVLKEFCMVFENFNFRNLNDRVGNMEMVAAKVIDSFDKILKLKKSPLQVERIEIEVPDQARIPSILSSLDSKTLKSITLAPAGLKAREALGIGEMRKLDQWKKTKELEIYQFVLPGPINSFLHFEKVNIVLQSINKIDLLYLKQCFLRYSNLNSFKINVFQSQLLEDMNLTQIFVGHSCEDFDAYGARRKRWFYETMRSADQVLMIHYNFHTCIHFCLVKLDDIPGNAIVELNE